MLTTKQQTILKRLGLTVCFIGAILITTRIALQFGAVANAATVGFCFLIVIALSAVFTEVWVALATSVVATLCFNYFFLPPIGTFFIADFDNWIALIVFLCTGILISRLTASAHSNARISADQATALEKLKEFGMWLLSLQRDQISLSGIADGAARVFSLPYCSIHVHTAGKWQHFSSSSSSYDLSHQVAKRFISAEDFPTRLMDLVDEGELGVRYSQIMRGSELVAVLAIKSDTLPANALNIVACMIGTLVPEMMGVK